RHGSEWAPLAISHIGTRRAVELLLADLRHDPDDHYSYVTDGLIALSSASVPYLVEAFTRDKHDAGIERYFSAIGFVMHAIGEASAPAVAPLAELAIDAHESPHVRRGAIRALGDIGPVAAWSAPQLRTLLTPVSGYSRYAANALGR